MQAPLPGRSETVDVRRVTLATALFYLAFTLLALAWHRWDPTWFIWIGTRFSEGNPAGNTGYDGQFVYYIARDWLDAAPLLDLEAYRFQRILLPILARGLSFGAPALLPWSLIGINLMAVIATTGLLARFLTRRQSSAWWALMYGLYLGTFMAYSRSLTEPLAYLLALLGLLAWRDKRYSAGVIAFALAGLTKEQALLVPVGVGTAMLFQRRWRHAVALFVAPLPLIAWELFLWQQFGTLGIGQGSQTGLLPLAGILSQLSADPGRLFALVVVALPALGLTAVALRDLRRDSGDTLAWVLLWHAVFVLLLPADVYDHIMHAGRNAAGLVLAATLSLPAWKRPLRLALAGVWVAPTALWLLPVLRFAPWNQIG